MLPPAWNVCGTPRLIVVSELAPTSEPDGKGALGTPGIHAGIPALMLLELQAFVQEFQQHLIVRLTVCPREGAKNTGWQQTPACHDLA